MAIQPTPPNVPLLVSRNKAVLNPYFCGGYVRGGVVE